MEYIQGTLCVQRKAHLTQPDAGSCRRSGDALWMSRHNDLDPEGWVVICKVEKCESASMIMIWGLVWYIRPFQISNMWTGEISFKCFDIIVKMLIIR